MTDSNLTPADKAMAAMNERTKNASKKDKHKGKPATGYPLGSLRETMRAQPHSQVNAPQRTSLT